MKGWMVLAGVISLVFSTIATKAQIADDFSDGNFTANPIWTGDSAKFEVNSSGQLHLKSSGTDTSYLSTPSLLIDSTEWSFWIKFSFSASANNYGRVYLVSDQANLKGPLNGYFLQFGEAGSNDAIELFRQSGTTNTSVCRGPQGMVAGSFALRVRVTRRAGGHFEVFADTLGGVNYSLIASGIDNIWTSTACFGPLCRYTTTNSTKFYFDDFSVREIFMDVTPPEALSAVTLNNHQVEVQFSEIIDTASASNPLNYWAGPGPGNPVTAARDAADPSRVLLTFALAFGNGVIYHLDVSNVQDVAGNSMVPSQLSFDWYLVKQFDVVINEIMADPEPQVGIPPYEYVELYNRTPVPINLNNWKFITGSTTRVMPDVMIPAHGFLLLASEQARLFLAKYGPFAGFSSFSLANDGALLVLQNEQGNIISSINYTSGWYQNPLKSDGGWSLEQVDPSNPCAGITNWRASLALAGGTPGKINSLNASNPDHSPPELLKITVTGPAEIMLYFSEPLDSASLGKATLFTIDHGLGEPTGLQPIAPEYRNVRLSLGNTLQDGIIYTLAIRDSIADCAGNLIDHLQSGRFAIPAAAITNDIIINEILYAPKNDGVEFVEIYNRSPKVIDLKDLVLSAIDTVSGTLDAPKTISNEGFLVFPGDYIVLTSDPDIVKSQYYTSNPKGFVSMASWPEMTNTGGTVALADKGLNIIDQAFYSDDLQFPLLASTQGVSLERLGSERHSNDKTNWHSAAETCGFATPAYKNSQKVDFLVNDENFRIIPEIFSPDNDGYNDILNLVYHFDQPGFVANLWIFNDRGQLIKNLIKNELLGTSGGFTWDGLDEKRQKAPIGIYIVMAEFFDTSGHVDRLKKAIVLAGRISR